MVGVSVKPSFPSCGRCLSVGAALLVGALVGFGMSIVPQTCVAKLRQQAAKVSFSKKFDSTSFNPIAAEKYLSSFKAADASYQTWCKQKMTGVNVEQGKGSQFEQDVFMFFNFFLEKAIRGEQGFYIDSGANDWSLLSNTLFYDKCLGWKGICLEPDPAYAVALQQNRSCSFFPECISSKTEVQSFTFGGSSGHVGGESKVNCRSLRDFMVAAGAASTKVDFWSLDVEGFEMTVLNSGIPFDQIRLILIENFWISTRDSDFLLNQAGYVKFAQMAIDGLFLRHEHDTWYPPDWQQNWESNQRYREVVKPMLDQHQ